MSELTECNYHTLKRLQERYGKKNVRWAVVHRGEMRGWIHVEYREGPVKAINVAKEEVVRDNTQGEWRTAGWFMQLTAHCVC
jgi:hypothetical protein